MNDLTTYIALDAHKNQHKVAMICPGSSRIEEWTVANTAKDLRRMLARIQRSSPGRVEICYEAGVCGFALQRQLTCKGVTCQVIAPSLIPIKPGERIKTDRRDAVKLVNLHRAALLTEVHAPSERDESVRDLVRAREAAQGDLLRARHRLGKFLIRRAMVYRDGHNWTQKHHRWLRSLAFSQKIDRYVFEEYLATVLRRGQAVAELTSEVGSLAEESPYCEKVGWLRCFRGIDTLAAMTLVVELHSFERFTSPRGLMGYLGLTPSENSSGQRDRKGGITKAGNRRVRRILTEISWHQAKPATVSKPLYRRRVGQPAWAITLADMALRRLHNRYWRLVGKGKLPTKAAIAVARELVGFVWAALYLQEQSVAGGRQRRRRPQRRCQDMVAQNNSPPAGDLVAACK